MMKSVSRIVVAVFSAAALLWAVQAYSAKETPPKPEKLGKLTFPGFKELKTKKGTEVIVVEQHEQPVVTLSMVVRAGDGLDPTGKEALAGFTVELLNKGTASKTALELAQWIESVGGSVNTGTEEDYSVLTVQILSDYLAVAYEYLQDVFLNPVFPDDEIENLRKRIKTSLELELSDPAAMAQRHTRRLVYGDHPYAKQATVESVEAITRDDIVGFHKRNYVPNNVLLAVVGDVKWKDVKKAVESHFGAWEPGSPDAVAYEGAPDAGSTKIYLYHRPGAAQTEVYIGHLAPKADNPDWPAIVVGTRILGGGADARLFMNLREEKGWTYGAYASMSREKDLGLFVARAAVRTEVTDSAMVELMKEVRRIAAEPVSQEDLDNAKSYLVGSFPLSIETPNQIAGQVVQFKLLGLGKRDLETYRDRIAAVTVDDVARAMKSYVRPDNAYVVLVGDALAVRDKVEASYDVELFDIAGAPLSFDALAVAPVDYSYDTSMLKAMKATYSLTVQQMNIGDFSVTMEKKKSGEKDVFEVSTSLAGMITLEEQMAFNAVDLSPVSYKRKMVFGPREMNAELAFTETSASGTVQTMESPEPKDVTFQLVGGTILDSTVEYAMGCLPLEVNGSYRFPVVDSESGALQNLDVQVIEVVDVETAAGKFKAYKIRVKRSDGEAFMYLGQEKPHIMVKQEVPSQGMLIVLKSITN